MIVTRVRKDAKGMRAHTQPLFGVGRKKQTNAMRGWRRCYAPTRGERETDCSGRQTTK